jgi:hypothetical protein
MGCDIHLVPEMHENGVWSPVIDAVLPGARNYRLFARMANVRNSGDVTPISHPRGLPMDCAQETLAMLSDNNLHSHSWLSSSEITTATGDYDSSGCLVGLRTYIESLYYRPAWRLVFAFDN